MSDRAFRGRSPSKDKDTGSPAITRSRAASMNPPRSTKPPSQSQSQRTVAADTPLQSVEPAKTTAVPGAFESFQSTKSNGNPEPNHPTQRLDTESEEEDLDQDLDTTHLQQKKKEVVSFISQLNWKDDPTQPSGLRLENPENFNDVHFADAKELLAQVNKNPKLWALILRRASNEITRLAPLQGQLQQLREEQRKLQNRLLTKDVDDDCANCLALSTEIEALEDEINTLNTQNDDAQGASQTALQDAVDKLSSEKRRVLRRQATIDDQSETLGKMKVELEKYGKRAKDAQLALTATTQDLTQARQTIKDLERGRAGGAGRTQRSVSFASNGTSPSPRRPSRTPSPRRRLSPSKSTASTTSTARARHVKIPDPQVFKGDKKIYKKWRGDMIVKIQHDYDDNSAGAINYIANRTEGLPYARLENRFSFNCDKNAFVDYKECFVILDKHFKEHDELAKALSEYDALKMEANESFSDFHNKWETLITKLDKSEATLAYELKKKLNVKYYNAVYQDDFDLDQLVERCHSLSYKFAERDARIAANPSTSKPSGGKPTQKDGRTSSTTTSNTRQGSRTKNKVPFPEEYRGLPKMTSELKAQLDLENKCHGCRQVGHKSFEMACPLKQWREANDLATKSSSLSLNAIQSQVAQMVRDEQPRIEGRPNQRLLTEGPENE